MKINYLCHMKDVAYHELCIGLTVYALRAWKPSRAYQLSSNLLSTWAASTAILGQCYPSGQL